MKKWKRILPDFKVLIVLAYLLLGVMVLFTDILLMPMHHIARAIFGIMLILFGVFRIYSYYIFIKGKNEKES